MATHLSVWLPSSALRTLSASDGWRWWRPNIWRRSERDGAKSLLFGPTTTECPQQTDRSDETAASWCFHRACNGFRSRNALELIYRWQKRVQGGEMHLSRLSGSENSLYSHLVTNGKRPVAIINVYALEKKSSLLFPHAGRFNCPTSTITSCSTLSSERYIIKAHIDFAIMRQKKCVTSQFLALQTQHREAPRAF